jgi:multidrug efflux pump
MKFTDLFIRRPVLALVVSLVIIIAGIQAIGTLNVRQYPRSENASIVVTTVYVGASPELVRGFVTTPLERAIAAADGIDYMQSQSSQGFSTITARLKLNYDTDKALAEISSKVDSVRNLLPPEAQIPTLSIQSADSQFAAAYLSFSSDVLKQNEITEYLVRAIQPRLSALEGVQRADILGARTFAMRVWLKADRMAAFNISPAQVSAALAANNHLTALGTTKGSLIQVNLTANTDMRSVEEFKRLVIRHQNGAIVRLEDIADVDLGAEDYDTEVRFSGQTAVFIGIYPLPNANSLDVIKLVRTEMAGIQADLPSGVNAVIAYDATKYIDTAIHEVVHTLLDTLLIVVVVIFLFLGSFRSVLVPLVAIPISLIGGIFLMQLFGFTINLLTLLAIVLSVGLVVDDAIVVVENVERHLREGLTPLNAALTGARELVGPIIAMTITLAAVYAPIGLQGGITGSLFREFAFTLAGAVIISGVVALTLSPMMSAHLLRPGDEEHGFAGRIARDFDRLKVFYGRLLGRSLQNRGYVYAVWIVVSLLGVVMIANAPKELAPTEDQGVILGAAFTSANSTLDQVAPFASEVNKVFFSVPEAEFTFQMVQPSGGFGGLVLKPWDERKRNVFQVNSELQGKLQAIPGIQMRAGLPSALPGGDLFPFEVVISSTHDYDDLLPLAQRIADDAGKSGMFYFPPLIDVKIDQPQSEVIIDRDKVATLGLNLQQIGTDLAAAMGGNYVNFFDIGGRSYKVIPQVKRVDRLNPDQLKDIFVAGPGNGLIPLSTVATIQNTTVARSLNRFQQQNSVTLTGMAGRPLDQALKFVEDDAAKLLPKGFVVDYMGESRQLRRGGGDKEFYTMMGLAIILIFLVLAAQFNSFRDPFVIIFGSVPLAIFGAAIFMFLKMPNPDLPFWTNGWTTTLNIYSKVGLVTLVGLIAKNGILIVEFANKLQLMGKSKIEAVHEAAMTRLRPVLMTTVATVAGHFPLTLVTGAGAAARNSIGLTLVGGMSIGTIFTLFVVPSVYVLIAKDHARARSRASAAAEVAGETDLSGAEA